jgi:signal transduction histidine kinase
VTTGHGSARLETLRLEGAIRRVRQDIAVGADAGPQFPRSAVLVVALALFVGGFALRLSLEDPGALVANFYTVPIALIAVVFGLRAGLAAAAFAMALVWAWAQIDQKPPGLLGYSTRGAVFLLVAALVGYFAERLRHDIAQRRRAEAELAMQAHDLAVSNAELKLAVTRLEAFAEIARAVGGETELRTVLDRILDHGREIVGARTLVVYLEQDGELVAAASTDELRAGLPERVGSAHELSGSADEPGVLVVPLHWRGETLGALAAVGPLRAASFDEESHHLIASVAASAATAVATAQSVAADRLRHTIEASEEARARWARELHDETLQGLVGLRMLLASARRSDTLDQVGRAVSDAMEQTRREIVNLRRLIAELRPAALDELGLDAAIETLAERSAASAGLAVDTRVRLGNGAGPRLARETETTIYRLVQEALTNAVRHSGARRVRVDVSGDGEQIEVSVADDGHGFDPRANSAGFGLRGMRERVQLAGGELAIGSTAGGSTVRARLPARPR